MTDVDAPRVGAIIVAAGSSQRMGGLDKVFMPVAGRPLLAWTVSAFEETPLVSEIVVAVRRQAIQEGRALAQREGWRKVSQVCRGGVRRQDSVREALWRMTKCDWVLVHDGARPCIGPSILEGVLEAARETGAATLGLPVHDTVKRADSAGRVVETLDRTGLWLVQTPQAFRYATLWAAHEQAGEEATDDAALVERLGVPVVILPGSPQNVKVTVPADLQAVELWLARGKAPPVSGHD